MIATILASRWGQIAIAAVAIVLALFGLKWKVASDAVEQERQRRLAQQAEGLRRAAASKAAVDASVAAERDPEQRLRDEWGR